ncbi:MAG: hypothetical protein M1814_006098 [Vezdaea aestivalis]|nr:MAG: hypothetical protein M1814_006098 [Vezdaea aestivalis]
MDQLSPTSAPHAPPTLHASTGRTYCSTVQISAAREAELLGRGPTVASPSSPASKLLGCDTQGVGISKDESNYFSSLHWSPDGTTLLTVSADSRVRAFIVPPDLLSPRSDPLLLSPYTVYAPPSAPHAFAFLPTYTLSHPPSTLYLLSNPSVPISLRSTLSSNLITSYPLVHTQTEAHLPAHALCFLSESSFLAASPNRLTVFSLTTRDPVRTLLTPKPDGGGPTRIKGQIAALAPAYQTQLVAAGTLTRQIGLYDFKAESLRANTAFALPKAGSEVGGVKVAGRGVSSLAWAGDGDRYLVVAERESDTLFLYDVRVSGKLLNVVTGRRAMGNQRLTVEVRGGRVWAGGRDGMVRVWEKPWEKGEIEGGISTDWTFKVSSQAVAGVSVHPYANVVATASGERNLAERLARGWADNGGIKSKSNLDSKDEEEEFDNKLSIWTF